MRTRHTIRRTHPARTRGRYNKACTLSRIRRLHTHSPRCISARTRPGRCIARPCISTRPYNRAHTPADSLAHRPSTGTFPICISSRNRRCRKSRHSHRCRTSGRHTASCNTASRPGPNPSSQSPAPIAPTPVLSPDFYVSYPTSHAPKRFIPPT